MTDFISQMIDRENKNGHLWTGVTDKQGLRLFNNNTLGKQLEITKNNVVNSGGKKQKNVEVEYKEQLPIIEGGGNQNMEFDRQILKRQYGGKKSKSSKSQKQVKFISQIVEGSKPIELKKVIEIEPKQEKPMRKPRQPKKNIEPVKIEVETENVGCGVKRGKEAMKARGELIKKIMKEKGLKLMEASKYIKEHKLKY